MPMNIMIGLALGSVTAGVSGMPSNTLTSKSGIGLTSKAGAFLTSKA